MSACLTTSTRRKQGSSPSISRTSKENRTSKKRWMNICAENLAQQGANVFLTIDARIQSIAEEALRAVSRAGAVVVDPNNGNVLAMASVPSFDPNTFIPSIKAKDWKALQKDEGDPLVNRSISCLPPGST